jgi:outer membrane protein assembly factor BamB
MFIVLFLVFNLLNPVNLFADREAPEKIPPIIYKNLKIVTENNSPGNMGLVQAFDINTNKLIWSKQVYEVKIKSRVEADTQWVFIKDMKIDGDKLVVLNEKQKVCTLDPTTGENLDKIVTILYIVLPVTLIILLFIIFTRKKLGN